MRIFLDILVFLITKKQYINRQGLLLSVSRVNFDCRHYELHDIIMCRNARDIFRVSVYSTFNTNINILRKTRRYDRPFKWFVLKFTLHVRENHFLIVVRYFVLKMIEGPKFVIAVTLKKYYKEVTQCTMLNTILLETIKEQTIKKELIFVPRVVHIWFIHDYIDSRCIHFFCCYRQIAVFHISSKISDVSCVSVLRNIKSLSIFIGCIELYFLL